MFRKVSDSTASSIWSIYGEDVRLWKRKNVSVEKIIEKQRYVLNEPEGKAIMFAGRILNLDEQLEK